jgi:ATP adenylyltransferase
MKTLWSPWRIKYIQRQEREKGCIFCDAAILEDSPENLIIHRSELGFVILNRYPYTSGHVMVVPFAHQPSFEDLDTTCRAEMMELINSATKVVREVYRPEGFNIGANLGAEAGAGVTGHVHFHIVPRWGGDTNFMSTISEVRVIPEDIAETYQRLKSAWK